jgi:Protein of unknown function (DUF3105)
LVRRVALALAAVVVAVGAVIGLVLVLGSRDQGGVGSANAAGPGRVFPDQGDHHLKPGEPRPGYDSMPPTSGPHHPVPVTRDAARLSDDQLLHALELGDVVLLYGQARPPAPLVSTQRAVAGPFSPALAAQGQAVILGRRPGTRGVVAVAWRRLLSAASPTDPRLAHFADYWLGAGVAG